MAGLRVLNSDGWAQIDSEHRNVRLHSKGTIAVTDANTEAVVGGNVLSYRAILALNTPILAFRCPVQCSALSEQTLGAWGFWMFTASPAIVEWWAFDVGTSATYNSGIRIWNAAGEQVYDGNDRVPKVVGAGGGGSYPGSLVAVMQMGAGIGKAYYPQIGALPAHTQTQLPSAATPGNNSVTTGTVTIRAQAGNAGTTSTPGANRLMLDVSGL